MDRIYCSEQIEVPPALPSILKAYTKEVIRYAPADIPAFSRDYFAALARGDVEAFLEEQAKRKKQADAQAAAAAGQPQH
jgi:hypothetical protein